MFVCLGRCVERRSDTVGGTEVKSVSVCVCVCLCVCVCGEMFWVSFRYSGWY